MGSISNLFSPKPSQTPALTNQQCGEKYQQHWMNPQMNVLFLGLPDYMVLDKRSAIARSKSLFLYVI